MQGELHANRDQQETKVRKKKKIYSWKEREAWWTPAYLRGLKNELWLNPNIWFFWKQRGISKTTPQSHIHSAREPISVAAAHLESPSHIALRNCQLGHRQDLVDASNPPSWTATTINPALQSWLQAFPHHCHIHFSAILVMSDLNSVLFSTCAPAVHCY